MINKPDRWDTVESHADLVSALAKLVAVFSLDASTGVSDPVATAMIADVTKLLANAKDHALHIMQAHDKLLPVFLFMSRTVTMIPFVLSDMPVDEDDRMLLASGLNFVVTHAPIDAYHFLTERWFASVNPKDEATYQQMPSQHSDRIEGMFIRVATPLHSFVSIFKTIRDAAGKVVDLVQMMEFDDDTQSVTYNPLMRSLYTLSPNSDSTNYSIN